MIMTSFTELVEVMNLKTRYEDIINSSKLSVPKKYKGLSTESANWCIQKIDVFNKKHPSTNDIKSLCLDYLERGANIRLAAVIEQHDLKEWDYASSTQEQAS
jgi:hypothetical protein